MNERIKELAKEAELLVYQDPEKEYAPTKLEKFAVLILQECMDQCGQVAEAADKRKNNRLVSDSGRMLYEGTRWGANECARQIREHFFGVKK